LIKGSLSARSSGQGTEDAEIASKQDSLIKCVKKSAAEYSAAAQDRNVDQALR
jgi:hypothetical protein